MESDLAAHGGAAGWLAYAHPLFMLASLLLVLLALRAGLALRSARRLAARRNSRAYARHVRIAKLAVLMLPLGFAAGIASAVLLRGWDALGSAHGWISSGTLALFLAAARLGRKLERRTAGEARAPDTHALLGALAVLCAAASLFTGFVLLP